MARNLPEKFISRMQKTLPLDEREAFFAEYEKPPVKGIRVNALKISGEEYEKISPFSLKKTPFAKDCYHIDVEKVGWHAHHFAGLIYSQEPTASSAAPMLDIQEGEKVLDLCSAPGGKGTQCAAYLKGTGLIVLNEPIPSRAHVLLSNVERMGIKNAVVFNEYPDTLAEFFGEYFDKILVDAPCSGEGMFRKNAEEALKEWSEENVALCAARQKDILSAAAKMLVAGGRMVYSTCTFSEEEDEKQVEDFLKNHPEFTLVSSTKLLPHKVKGEGHFVAVFVKNGDKTGDKTKIKKGNLTLQAERAFRAFEKEFFFAKFAERLYEANGCLYELPKGVFEWKNLRLLRAGIKLGEMKNGRFEPSHALAMCVKKEECKNVVDYSLNDSRAEKFLRGETVEDERAKNGWLVVCVDGYPIGLGKAVNGTIKNHIPKALRKMK